MTAKRTARLAALAALPTALVLAAGSPAAADTAAYQVDLAPLNNSGATGTAMLSLDNNRLTVKIEADGLTPNAPHAQHIHGDTNGHDRICPDASDDKDGDGIVTTSEGLPKYGDINISLTTEGDTSADSGLAVDRMPVADAKGHLSYERTITVSDEVAEHIKDLHVVQHGIDANRNGEYDFGIGKSDLDPKLPQEATAPATCGMVLGAAVGSIPVGGVETGTGGTDKAGAAGALGIGGALLVGAGAVVAVSRRRGRAAATKAED